MQLSNVLVVMYVSLSSVCCQKCQNCYTGRVQGLRSADCYRKELTRVPHCLPGNTEVLDLSTNRIREILEDDLNSYPYLQILYLQDNLITYIHEEALDDLTSLRTLDLSFNALYKIPAALFSLPVLWKLQLGGIGNQNMLTCIESARPVTSPLIYLDLSYNKLSRLPILGEVPTLQYYNVSGNKNVRLNTTMFAGLCNLLELHDDGFTATFDSPCDCFILERWLAMRHVQFKPLNCQTKECKTEIPQTDLDTFKSCMKQYEAQQQQMYKKKLLTNIGISMGTIALFLLILLFFIFRRHRARKQKKKMEKQSHLKQQKKEGIDDLL